MSPPRRRSARLASSQRSIKSATASHLSSLDEHDESSMECNHESMTSPLRHPQTPSHATPIKLPHSEMHPSKVHQTMAPPSSGLSLGFVDINPGKSSTPQPSGLTQSTPTRSAVAPSSSFTFRLTRNEKDLGLTPQAQRMMAELREEAAKIKADLAAKRDQEATTDLANGRKIVKPKGKANRYSAVHMAEFKKMDSIENHPSAYRGVPSRTPAKSAGIKRSQSKANLHDDEPDANITSHSRFPKKVNHATEADTPAKRIRQRVADDASTARPVSRDGSFIPRPKSSGNDSVHGGIPRSQTLGSLMTPTKASMARTMGKNQTVSLVRSSSKPDLAALAKSPSKADLSTPTKTLAKSIFAGLTKSATVGNLAIGESQPTRIQTPGRFDRVKSILKRRIISPVGSKTSIPHFSAAVSKTPGSRLKDLPPLPQTTPGRKATKQVDFTPDTKSAALSQNSPSPVKSSSSVPRNLVKFGRLDYPSLDGVLDGKGSDGTISYPDLSSFESLSNEPKNESQPLPQSVPGTFTFRSDHTIRFDSTSPTGFGGSAGQASLRHVRPSMGSTPRMPGSFPGGSMIAISSPNKENKDPKVLKAAPHGILNKKRHRASWDEEETEDEGVKRGAKKLRKDPPVAEGDALVAPRLISEKTPLKKPAMARAASATPSPQKKKAGMSLSRLNMLARPKIRK